MTVRAWVVGAAALVVVAVAAGALLVASDDGAEARIGAVAGIDPWDDVVAEAQGQTVRLWMWGGETALNGYIDEDVVPAAAAAGVALERVPVDDTATAVAQIAAEVDGGRSRGGSVDLLWINGVNFAQGRDAGLWMDGWAAHVPNAGLLDVADPTLTTDFGVPTDGQELAWSRAAFVFAHDTARVPDPPRTVEALVGWVRAHPGRFTYPPHFTGSAFVRQAVQVLGEEEAFRVLAEMRPFLWSGGETFPRDQPELERLFAEGEVDLVMSYNPNFVDVAVERGAFADTTRPFVLADGTLQNVSFLAIPANASSGAGAQVVADLMLGARLQATKLVRVGIPSVLPPEVLIAEVEDRGLADEHRLTDLGPPLAELPVADVAALDARWRAEVLR